MRPKVSTDLNARAAAERRRGFALGAATLAALVLLVSCLRESPPPESAETHEVRLAARGFGDLPGWNDGDMRAALQSFRRSCDAFARMDPDAMLGGEDYAGKVRDWLPVCGHARRAGASKTASRIFFEEHFRPFAVSDTEGAEGLFTGYYEPELRGSRTRSAEYATPLYGRPGDLVIVDLGRFRPGLAGDRIAGRVENGQLVPYPSRGDIVRGVLEGRATPLLYVDNGIDAFFLHIQGSGRVLLNDGTMVRVGYEAQNGHPYVAIGRVLIDAGELTKDGVSMQSIRAWLTEHPDRAEEVMDTNPSYVFFKELPLGDPALGPVGAQGVELTDEASLAVDRRHHALGLPFWLDGFAPAEGGGDRKYQRLLIAQDTGGAIRGVVRGDVFWGHGDGPADIAGRMQHRGEFYVLLPKAVAARHARR